MKFAATPASSKVTPSEAPAGEATASAEPTEEASGKRGPRPPVPGHRLIDLVRRRLAAHGEDDRKAADILGITPVYWNSISSGHRSFSSLPKEKMAKLAKFLDLPLAELDVLSDRLAPEDFLRHSTLEEELDASLEKMRAHPSWKTMAPDANSWNATPLRSKIAMMLLFEQVAQEQLLRRVEIAVAPTDPEFVLVV